MYACNDASSLRCVFAAACASFTGPSLAAASSEYIEAFGLADKMKNASHLLWATGGSMVPDAEMKLYYERGSQR